MKVAVVQMESTSDEQANWESARALITEAASSGAKWVGTPEHTNYVGSPVERVRRAEALDGPVCKRFSKLARRLSIYLLLGSFDELSKDRERCFSTSVFFGPDGRRLGAYRKIHLLDASLPDGRLFRETKTSMAGSEPVVVECELGSFGLSISYDLRFPELYRQLVVGGAEFLAVPSSFTKSTGADHWNVLLQARAIENQAFVLAPAQCGRHDDGGQRVAYGRAVILDPWGKTLAVAGNGPGIALTELDLDRLREIRASMSVLQHWPSKGLP